MLSVWQSGIFVEPLPDQIAVVYEYQQFQVYFYKERWQEMDFLALSDSGDFESNARLRDSEHIHEGVLDLFSDASTSVPRLYIKRELVRPSVHRKWFALVVSTPVKNQCCVVLKPWGIEGVWGVCLCFWSFQLDGKTVWVDRDDHFTIKKHTKAVWYYFVTEIRSSCRGNPFEVQDQDQQDVMQEDTPPLVEVDLSNECVVVTGEDTGFVWEEKTVPECVQSPAVKTRDNRWARRAVRVQQRASHLQLESSGGRRASGAWVYYPMGMRQTFILSVARV